MIRCHKINKRILTKIHYKYELARMYNVPFGIDYVSKMYFNLVNPIYRNFHSVAAEKRQRGGGSPVQIHRYT